MANDVSQVLEEVRAVAAELVELRKDVKIALTHGGDIEKLKKDVQRIDSHLRKIDEFMAGPPALTERLAALEQKQAKDHAEDAEGVEVAGTFDDAAHTGETERRIALSDERTELKFVPVRAHIKQNLDAVLSLRGTLLVVISTFAIVLAVVINIGWSVLAR